MPIKYLKQNSISPFHGIKISFIDFLVLVDSLWPFWSLTVMTVKLVWNTIPVITADK